MHQGIRMCYWLLLLQLHVHADLTSTIDQSHHPTQHCMLCEDLEYNVLYFCNLIHWGLGFIYDLVRKHVHRMLDVPHHTCLHTQFCT